MKRNITTLVLILIAYSFSFAQSIKSAKPLEDPKEILKDEMALLSYGQNYLKLSEDYVALNENSRTISREAFLKFLSTGGYLPLRLVATANGPVCYRLYKLNTPFNRDISSTLRQWGESYYKYFRMEGSKVPDFNFTDLNGKVYNKETMTGKILVLKCWYLSCQVCREEIPSLNALVDQYKRRKDILFLSLAFDKRKDLKKFIEKNKFNYATVASKKDYLMKELAISEYPTHLIVKNGLIVKVVQSSDELIVALNKEASQKQL